MSSQQQFESQEAVINANPKKYPTAKLQLSIISTLKNFWMGDILINSDRSNNLINSLRHQFDEINEACGHEHVIVVQAKIFLKNRGLIK